MILDKLFFKILFSDVLNYAEMFWLENGTIYNIIVHIDINKRDFISIEGNFGNYTDFGIEVHDDEIVYKNGNPFNIIYEKRKSLRRKIDRAVLHLSRHPSYYKDNILYIMLGNHLVMVEAEPINLKNFKNKTTVTIAEGKDPLINVSQFKNASLVDIAPIKKYADELMYAVLDTEKDEEWF